METKKGTWGIELKIQRMRVGLSQSELAERCAQMSDDTVSTWEQLLWTYETGRSIPAPEQAAILERVLGLESVANAATR